MRWVLESFEEFLQNANLHHHSSATVFDEGDECVYVDPTPSEEGE